MNIGIYMVGAAGIEPATPTMSTYGARQKVRNDGHFAEASSGVSGQCCQGVHGLEVHRAREHYVAALYVATNGCYFGLEGVDPWDKMRDARTYAGPWPVVAHPPCERWGRYWGGAPSTWPRLKMGDDGGCFAAALAAVRRWGGVLEHPEGSHAWRAFGLNLPPRCGGWIVADFEGGWTCCVEQGAYGHRARKATWLYAHGVELPSLRWGSAPGDFVRLGEGFHSIEERRRAVKTGACQRLSANQRRATPVPFRDLLISIAAGSPVARPSTATLKPVWDE